MLASKYSASLGVQRFSRYSLESSSAIAALLNTLDKSSNISGTDGLDTAIESYGDLIAVVQDTTDVSAMKAKCSSIS